MAGVEHQYHSLWRCLLLDSDWLWTYLVYHLVTSTMRGFHHCNPVFQLYFFKEEPALRDPDWLQHSKVGTFGHLLRVGVFACISDVRICYLETELLNIPQQCTLQEAVIGKMLCQRMRLVRLLWLILFVCMKSGWNCTGGSSAKQVLEWVEDEGSDKIGESPNWVCEWSVSPCERLLPFSSFSEQFCREWDCCIE